VSGDFGSKTAFSGGEIRALEGRKGIAHPGAGGWLPGVTGRREQPKDCQKI
jgi:hypothetical protein